MTYAPPTLRDLDAYWRSQGGVGLGIVGDAPHVSGGTSYHLGADQLVDGAYSAILPRDKAGLTNGASAIDLGKLGGTLGNLQRFSTWLVWWCQAGGTGSRDIREVIYSPDGWNVRRYNATDGRIYVGGDGTGQGDNSHRYHTHVSYWRDSEYRDKREPFRAYFGEMPDTSTDPDGGTPVMEIPVADDFQPFLAVVTIKVPTALAIYTKTGQTLGLPKGLSKQAVAKATIGPVTLPGGIVISGPAYLIGSQPAWLLERDVNVQPIAPPTNPTPDEVAAYNQGVQTVKAAAAAVPER